MSPILARLLRMTGFLPFALAMGSGGRLVAEQLNVQLTVTWESARTPGRVFFSS